MTKELLQGIVAILVVGGAIAAALLDSPSKDLLIPIASFVVGFLFPTGIGKVKGLIAARKNKV